VIKLGIMTLIGICLMRFRLDPLFIKVQVPVSN